MMNLAHGASPAAAAYNSAQGDGIRNNFFRASGWRVGHPWRGAPPRISPAGSARAQGHLDGYSWLDCRFPTSVRFPSGGRAAGGRGPPVRGCASGRRTTRARARLEARRAHTHQSMAPHSVTRGRPCAAFASTPGAAGLPAQHSAIHPDSIPRVFVHAVEARRARAHRSMAPKFLRMDASMRRPPRSRGQLGPPYCSFDLR